MDSPLPATNRQKKLIRFCHQPVDDLTFDQASRIIDDLMDDPSISDRWRRYKWVTRDFDRTTDDLLPHSAADLDAAEVPEGWDGEEEAARADKQLVQRLFEERGVLDMPTPTVQCEGRVFGLTGRFAFGSRKKVAERIAAAGGTVNAGGDVTRDTHYLVIGSKGSTAYAHGSYGRKIADAILLRFNYRRIAIVAEESLTSILVE